MGFGDLTSRPFDGIILDVLNTKHPIGSFVTVRYKGELVEYRIDSSWTREASYYGAWGRSETKNNSIWITTEEIESFRKK